MGKSKVRRETCFCAGGFRRKQKKSNKWSWTHIIWGAEVDAESQKITSKTQWIEKNVIAHIDGPRADRNPSLSLLIEAENLVYKEITKLGQAKTQNRSKTKHKTKQKNTLATLKTTERAKKASREDGDGDGGDGDADSANDEGDVEEEVESNVRDVSDVDVVSVASENIDILVDENSNTCPCQDVAHSEKYGDADGGIKEGDEGKKDVKKKQENKNKASASSMLLDADCDGNERSCAHKKRKDVTKQNGADDAQDDDDDGLSSNEKVCHSKKTKTTKHDRKENEDEDKDDNGASDNEKEPKPKPKQNQDEKGEKEAGLVVGDKVDEIMNSTGKSEGDSVADGVSSSDSDSYSEGVSGEEAKNLRGEEELRREIEARHKACEAKRQTLAMQDEKHSQTNKQREMLLQRYDETLAARKRRKKLKRDEAKLKKEEQDLQLQETAQKEQHMRDREAWRLAYELRVQAANKCRNGKTAQALQQMLIELQSLHS